LDKKTVVMYKCKECDLEKKRGTNFKYIDSVRTVEGDYANIQMWKDNLCSPCGKARIDN